MEPEARYALVGTVTMLLIALVAAALVWIRSTGESTLAKRYTVYFEHQSLEGVQPRGSVTMRGMRVGSVESFHFSARHPGAIEVQLAVDPDTPVRESTRAMVQRHFVTGLAVVALESADEASPRLEKVPAGEAYPVIPEGRSEIQEMSQSIEQLARHADETLQQLNATLSPENRAAFSEILLNLRAISRHSEGTLAQLDHSLAATGQAAEELRQLARSVSTDAKALAARYDGLGADAALTVRDVRESARRLGESADRVADRADRLLTTADSELRETTRSLRAAAEATQAAASRLSDPHDALFGPAPEALGPGEKSR